MQPRALTPRRRKVRWRCWRRCRILEAAASVRVRAWRLKLGPAFAAAAARNEDAIDHPALFQSFRAHSFGELIIYQLHVGSIFLSGVISSFHLNLGKSKGQKELNSNFVNSTIYYLPNFTYIMNLNDSKFLDKAFCFQNGSKGKPNGNFILDVM